VSDAGGPPDPAAIGAVRRRHGPSPAAPSACGHHPTRPPQKRHAMFPQLITLRTRRHQAVRRPDPVPRSRPGGARLRALLAGIALLAALGCVALASPAAHAAPHASLVSDINPTGYSYPQELTDGGGTLFFTADDGTHRLRRGRRMARDVAPRGDADRNTGRARRRARARLEPQATHGRSRDRATRDHHGTGKRARRAPATHHHQRSARQLGQVGRRRRARTWRCSRSRSCTAQAAPPLRSRSAPSRPRSPSRSS
jgi:hypothetical protein